MIVISRVDSEVIQRKDGGNKGHGSYHKNSQMSWIAAFLESEHCCSQATVVETYGILPTG